MTVTDAPPLPAAATAPPSADPPEPLEPEPAPERRVGVLVALWIAVAVATIALVLYLLAPLFQARTQAALLETYRAKITQAANEALGLPGVSVPTKAPDPGAPVGILEIASIQLRQVVVEGATSPTTKAGPGHVAGTAGPGQAGNSVVVGRRAMFGAPFADLNRVAVGDPILVTTTQGQTVYRVESVEERELRFPVDPGTAPAAGTGARLPGAVPTAEIDEVYGPTPDDRLTLVTSASLNPWNASRATVVVATMETQAFAPTPQGGRTDQGTGLKGDGAAWPSIILWAMAFVACAAAAAVLYRRTTSRVAYIITTPPLIVSAILLAESVSRLLPSWS